MKQFKDLLPGLVLVLILAAILPIIGIVLTISPLGFLFLALAFIAIEKLFDLGIFLKMIPGLLVLAICGFVFMMIAMIIPALALKFWTCFCILLVLSAWANKLECPE